MRTSVLALASLCIALASAHSQTPVPAAKQPDVTRMEKIVQDAVKENHFMSTVLVDRDGKAILDKGYGSADLEWNIPSAPDTRFRLGSITKQFTAASILLLEERGKLKVEDPISKYMRDPPAAWKKITFVHLLSHTSGIPSFTSSPDYEQLQSRPVTSEQLVARFRARLPTRREVAGMYQLAPEFLITITLQGDHLVAQATNQPTAPIFASSPTRFSYRVVD